jgi:hypothetical protein
MLSEDVCPLGGDGAGIVFHRINYLRAVPLSSHFRITWDSLTNAVVITLTQGQACLPRRLRSPRSSKDRFLKHPGAVSKSSTCPKQRIRRLSHEIESLSGQCPGRIPLALALGTGWSNR